MKILHITNNYPTENLPIFGIFVKEQIESLSKIGCENDLFFANGYEKGKIEYLKGILRLSRKLKNNKYDIIHCHHALSGLMYLLTPKYDKTPRIISFQNDPVNEHGIVLFKILKLYFNAFIFKNNSKLIPSLNGKGYYLPNGVNTDFFSPIDQNTAKKKVNLDQKKKYVLFVSSFLVRNQKRIDRYDQTMAFLKENYPVHNFEELKLVNVERKFMPFYFNGASVHLLTSDFEGSPNSVKESISCNTPVVSTNVGNVKEMLEGAENCFVSDDYSPEVLAKLVVQSTEQQSDIRKEIFEKKLDMESVAVKLFGIYKSLLKGNQDGK